MAIADSTFVTHLDQREAMGYSELPHWGLLHKPPALYYMFLDSDSARRCFEIFQSWISASSGDGDAVEITFLEFEDGSYGVITGPEVHRLIKRAIPAHLLHEVDPIALVQQKMIHIPRQSDWYRWFKGAASSSPFVVMPATRDDGPIEDLAFRKREVAFFRASEVPPHHPAIPFARGNREARSAHPPPTLKPQEIVERRGRQLERFFPVTLERLRTNPHFRGVQDALRADGLSACEVRQAACNLTLWHRHPDLLRSDEEAGGGPGPSVLEFLLRHHETVEAQPLPGNMLSVEAITRQVLADRRYLLAYVSDGEDDSVLSDGEVAEALDRLGLLGS